MSSSGITRHRLAGGGAARTERDDVVVSEMDVVAMAREERAELADFLASLRPEHWMSRVCVRGGASGTWPPTS